MPTKVHLVKAMGFTLVMYGCESWTIKKAEHRRINVLCFWTVVLEKTVENPLDCKEIRPVHHKENQPWMFTGRTKTPAPVLWPPDTKSWLIGKDPGAVKDWRQEEKGMTGQDGWHHLLNGHELEQALEDDERQKPGVLQSMEWQRETSEWLNNSGSAHWLRTPETPAKSFLRCTWQKILRFSS